MFSTGEKQRRQKEKEEWPHSLPSKNHYFLSENFKWKDTYVELLYENVE